MCLLTFWSHFVLFLYSQLFSHPHIFWSRGSWENAPWWEDSQNFVLPNRFLDLPWCLRQYIFVIAQPPWRQNRRGNQEGKNSTEQMLRFLKSHYQSGERCCSGLLQRYAQQHFSTLTHPRWGEKQTARQEEQPSKRILYCLYKTSTK